MRKLRTFYILLVFKHPLYIHGFNSKERKKNHKNTSLSKITTCF